jgi:hypothetical protein
MELFDHWYTIVLIVVGAVLLIPYVLGPILIRFTLRQSAEPEIVPFDVDDPELPDKVATYFRRVSEALEPLGFDVVAAMALPKQVPRVKAVLLMLANRTSKDAALASVLYAQQPDGTQVHNAFVEYVARFRDGTLVQTNNSKELNAFAPRPDQITTQFPMVRVAGRLYRLHQAMVERHGGTGRKILRLDEEFHGDAVAYLAQSLVEELDSQIETGYMYRSRQEPAYWPTWKGAFLMTWGQLWPFKAIRRARRDRKARQLMAELQEEGAS